MRRLPYLALLFLLLVTILGLYNMDHIMQWVSSLGQQTFTFLSYALAVFGILVALYMSFFLFFKYRLNRKHMQYQYYNDISNKYGLIILEDRTVLHKNGDLLIQGSRSISGGPNKWVNCRSSPKSSSPARAWTTTCP